jgi:hypothetical protein
MFLLGRERSSGASGGGREQCARNAGRSCARVKHAVRCGKRACGQRGAGTSIQKLCEGVEKLLTGERKSRRDWREGVGRMDGGRNYVQYCIDKFCTKMLHHL